MYLKRNQHLRRRVEEGEGDLRRSSELRVASANLVAADDVKEVAQFMEALALILMHGARQHPTPFNPCDARMDFRGLTREKAIKTVHTMHCDGLLSASFDVSLKLWRFGFVAS